MSGYALRIQWTDHRRAICPEPYLWTPGAPMSRAMAETQATIHRVGGRCRVEVVPVPDEVPDRVPVGDPVDGPMPGQLSLFGGAA